MNHQDQIDRLEDNIEHLQDYIDHLESIVSCECPDDTEMLDWLEEQNKKANYTGKCIFRWSSANRGWRLHETSRAEAVSSVRQAIRIAMTLRD